MNLDALFTPESVVVVGASRKPSVRLLGPNCLGLINTHAKLNASFAAGTPPSGAISFFSQSGALCTAILDRAIDCRMTIAEAGK